MANLLELAKGVPKGVKHLVPNRAKERIKGSLVDLIRWYRRFGDKMRPLPSFIIAGAQKCGTTTLYVQLSRHPNVIPALQKEINYFNVEFDRGPAWYRSNFPVLPPKEQPTSADGVAPYITGEATPGYMFYPYGFERIAKTCPDVKIIMVLRNPVDRTYSSYFHQIRKGREKYSFEKAIELEHERLAADMEKMSLDKSYYGERFRYFSYLTRGIYVDQVRRCLENFPAEQILILNSEEFFSDNAKMYKQVLEFLELPRYELSDYKNANKKIYENMAPQTRSKLVEYFRPYNAKLYELIGREFDWDK